MKKTLVAVLISTAFAGTAVAAPVSSHLADTVPLAQGGINWENGVHNTLVDHDAAIDQNKTEIGNTKTLASAASGEAATALREAQDANKKSDQAITTAGNAQQTADKADKASATNTGDITALKTKVADHQKLVDDHTNQIGDLRQKDTVMGKEVTDVTNRVAALETNTQNNNALAASVQNSAAAIQKEVDRNQDDIVKLKNNEILPLRQRVAQNEKDIIAHDTRITANDTAIKANQQALTTKVDTATYTQEQDAQNTAIKTAQDAADNEATRAKGVESGLDSRLSQAENTISVQGTQIADKVDKTAFAAAQKVQDDNLTNAVTAQKKIDDAQDTLIKGKVDQAAYSADIANINTTLGQKADQGDVDANKTAIADTKKLVGDETTRAQGEEQRIEAIANGANAQVSALNTQIGDKADKTTVDTLTQRVDGHDNDISGLTTSVQGKVDQAVYDQGQKDQNTEIGKKADTTALTAETNRATKAESDLDTKIGTKADSSALTALQSRVALDEKYDGDAISKNRQDIADEATRAKAVEKTHTAALTKVGTDLTQEVNRAKGAEKTLTAGLTKVGVATSQETKRATGEENRIEGLTKTNKTAIQTETTRATAAETRIEGKADTNAKGIAANKSALTTKVDTTTFTADQKRQDARIDTNTQSISRNETRITKNERTLSNHENRISTLEANQGYGNRFSALKNEVEQNRKHASAGIAGVAAMANIPQVSQGATFSVGAGAGTYDGEQGLAVGGSARLGKQVVTKFSVSATTQSDFVAGAGVSYEW
ncbi:hypothetical protein IAJ44_004219 [Salmonella enterica]|nr:hypothetical protein [Salmonella enterica]